MTRQGNPERLHRRLRTAGVLVLIALLLDTASLMWSHPTAFLLFLFGGGAFLAAGVLTYLYSLAVHSGPVAKE